MDLSTVTITHNLSESNKANAYKGNDTLVFISDAGDTATLYGQSKKQYYISNSTGNFNADCPKTTTYKNDNLDLIFSGNNSQLYKIEYHGFFDGSEATDFTVDDYTCSPFNADYFSYPINYNTKITIKGIDYNCVRTNDHPYIYYNSQIGIVRVDSISGKNWTLNK